MRDYEIVYIFRPETEPEDVEERLGSFHERLDGEVTAVEQWGQRELAYEIDGERRGYYAVAQFRAEPGSLSEFERALDRDRDLIRHLLVVSEAELPASDPARRDEDEEEDDRGDDEDDRDEDDGGDDSGDEDEDGAGDEAAADGEDEGDDAGDTDEGPADEADETDEADEADEGPADEADEIDEADETDDEDEER